MKPPSARQFNASVTVKVATYANVRGMRTPSYTSTAYQASVQPADPVIGDSHDQELGEIDYRVYLTTDPGCKRGDLIVWGSRTLEVIKDASDRAGRSAVYRIDCRELK